MIIVQEQYEIPYAGTVIGWKVRSYTGYEPYQATMLSYSGVSHVIGLDIN